MRDDLDFPSAAQLQHRLTQAAGVAHRACRDLAAAMNEVDLFTIAPSSSGARSVRSYIRTRQARSYMLGDGLFEDPAWDMLLDLFAAQAEGGRVSVSSLCLAAGCAPTTALRWINRLRERGLIERIADRADRRRAFVELSPFAHSAMTAYVARYAPTWPEARQ